LKIEGTEFVKQWLLPLPPLRLPHRGIGNPACAFRFSDDAKNIVILRARGFCRKPAPPQAGISLPVFRCVNPGAVEAYLR
jgi:hypothetical protein